MPVIVTEVPTVPEVGDRPVSYTHLDVYKRQRPCAAEDRDDRQEAEAASKVYTKISRRQRVCHEYTGGPAGFDGGDRNGRHWGCSGAGQSAKLRVFEGNATVAGGTILVDGATVSSNLQYESNTGYLSVKAGSRQVAAVPAEESDTGPGVIRATLSLSANTQNTLDSVRMGHDGGGFSADRRRHSGRQFNG